MRSVTDHVLGLRPGLVRGPTERPARGQRGDAGAVGAGRLAGQCDLLMMASCQFKKQSESRQLSAGAGRGIRAFLIKDIAKL